MTSPASSGAGAVPVDALAAALIALYTNAETRLLHEVATATNLGISDPALTAQARMLTEMRRAAQRVVNALQLRSEPIMREVLDTAAQRGDAAALAMLRRMVEGHPNLAKLYVARTAGSSGHALTAANMVALDLRHALQATWAGILRFPDDAYKAAVAESAARLVAGRHGFTPVTAQTRAWRDLTSRGITGFVDRAGRQWNLASYVEMATRTAVQRAYNASHQARMLSVGIRYFTVPHDGHPCPLCRPWEGAVLSTGRVGAVVDAAANDGRPVAFTVKATIEQAAAAGLWHPNCRHTLTAYLPGVTKTRPAAPWSQADQDRYQATERLRELERKVRAAKRQEQIAAAVRDEHLHGQARAKVRRYQAQIRDHIDRHGLVRRPRREQLDLGNR